MTRAVMRRWFAFTIAAVILAFARDTRADAESDKIQEINGYLISFFRGQVLVAFIDGMHLAEYALRDVINTERYCHAASVIVVDDVLPAMIVEIARHSALLFGSYSCRTWREKS